jgi:ankyrin repeat protein
VPGLAATREWLVGDVGTRLRSFFLVTAQVKNRMMIPIQRSRNRNMPLLWCGFAGRRGCCVMMVGLMIQASVLFRRSLGLVRSNWEVLVRSNQSSELGTDVLGEGRGRVVVASAYKGVVAFVSFFDCSQVHSICYAIRRTTRDRAVFILSCVAHGLCMLINDPKMEVCCCA